MLAQRVRKNVNEEFKRQIRAHKSPIKARTINESIRQTRKVTPQKLPKVLPEEAESSDDDLDETLKESNIKSSYKSATNCSNVSSLNDIISTKKNVSPATARDINLSTCTSSSSMFCESESDFTDSCVISNKKTCLTTTKPFIIEINSGPTPNIKIFEEKFSSDTEMESPNIEIIQKKLSPSAKSVEVICSQRKTKPHFNHVSELLKKKQTTAQTNPAISDNNYEYNLINNNSRPAPIPEPQEPENVITFDYNNKYTTCNLKTPNKVQREVDKTIPNANFQAQMENRERFVHEQNRRLAK